MSEEPIVHTVERDRRAKPVRATWPFLLAAAIVTALWSAISSLNNIGGGLQGVPADPAVRSAALLGYLTGGSLFVALFVWLVLHFGFVRSRNERAGLRHFLTLLVVSLVAGPGLVFVLIAAASRS